MHTKVNFLINYRNNLWALLFSLFRLDCLRTSLEVLSSLDTCRWQIEQRRRQQWKQEPQWFGGGPGGLHSVFGRRPHEADGLQAFMLIDVLFDVVDLFTVAFASGAQWNRFQR